MTCYKSCIHRLIHLQTMHTILQERSQAKAASEFHFFFLSFFQMLPFGD